MFKWFSHLKSSWDQQWRVYRAGMAAGDLLIQHNRFSDLPDEVQGDPDLLRIYLDGMRSSARRHE